MSGWRERLDGLEAEALGGGRELRHARSRRQKRRGLAGLEELPPQVALRIHGCRSVHTVGMRFPLDLLWLDAEGAVVRLDRGVPARRVRGCRAARSVVETLAGEGESFARLIGGTRGGG